MYIKCGSKCVVDFSLRGAGGGGMEHNGSEFRF